ncbi:MAG: AAA family ATPase [Clostridia bacterium]|nr:AAA family ATPase [Clostridia bacterium]
MYDNKKIIYIYGASGAGSTTLGENISKKSNGDFYDTDIYFWKHYENHQQRMDEMICDIKKCKKDLIIITGSFWNWKCDYKWLIDHIDYYIRVMLDPEIRMQRLEQREKDRYGSRIEIGGDLYEINKKRMEWAREYDNGGLDMRSLKSNIYFENMYKINPIIVNSINTVDENTSSIIKILGE